MDYKEQADRYRNMANRWECGEQLLLNGELRIQDTLRESAAAIETLLAERDAAVEWLRGSCINCKNFYSSPQSSQCADCRFDCGTSDHWEWRGLQKEK